MTYLRLRQLCLVARELSPVTGDLCHVLGLQVCHRDPGVERFGLHNALMRIGSAFIEVVAPLPGPRGENTAATRHLDRQGGDSGYMVILDCDDLAPWRAHMARVGVREAAYLEVPGNPKPLAYTGLQLHPRDTGGALLEINHSPGGTPLDGAYWPAGPHWQSATDCAWGTTLGGATLQSPEPAKLAARWSEVLQRPVLQDGGAHGIWLDNAMRLRFSAPAAGQAAGLTGASLRWRGARAGFEAVFAGMAERARNCLVDEARYAVRIGGVWWRCEAAPFE